MKFISPLLCFAICFSATSISNSQSPTLSSQAKSNHWLLNEKDPVQRTLKLEQYLRGFDQPMLEVGQRYQSLYQALLDNNYGLAEYQWKKIKTTIKNGIMKRPKRADNANSMLLNNAWADINADFISKNQSQAWQGFQKATSVCMACHIAEKVEFVNNQPLFRLKVPR